MDFIIIISFNLYNNPMSYAFYSLFQIEKIQKLNKVVQIHTASKGQSRN